MRFASAGKKKLLSQTYSRRVVTNGVLNQCNYCRECKRISITGPGRRKAQGQHIAGLHWQKGQLNLLVDYYRTAHCS